MRRYVEIKKATMEEVLFFAKNMREIDKLEHSLMLADNWQEPLAGEDLEKAFVTVYAGFIGKELYTVLYKGKPYVLFGLSVVDHNLALPFLVGLKTVENTPVSFLSVSHSVVKNWSDKYTLYNAVHNQNTKAIVYLKHLGFMIYEHSPSEVFEELYQSGFYLFCKEKETCAVQ